VTNLVFTEVRTFHIDWPGIQIGPYSGSARVRFGPCSNSSILLI